MHTQQIACSYSQLRLIHTARVSKFMADNIDQWVMLLLCPSWPQHFIRSYHGEHIELMACVFSNTKPVAQVNWTYPKLELSYSNLHWHCMLAVHVLIIHNWYSASIIKFYDCTQLLEIPRRRQTENIVLTHTRKLYGEYYYTSPFINVLDK